MASSEKRCLYEVLGLGRDCSGDEIKSAYRKLALQRHPDKLVQSGVSEAEATAAFQELVNAYEVLSDPRERAWYESHRNEILFSSSTANSSSGSAGFVPDLFSFFSNSVYSGYSDSGRGFYKVYGVLFEKIYANELNFAKKLGLPCPKEAPLMGNLESPYIQVTAFYNYWLGFTTSMDFFWADEYDAMAGPNRKSRRLMEDENKKLRKKAKREYNETVRGLAEFVKKRDKRVIDMQMKRNEEMERKKEEERQRKKELERLKAERARNYEEPEWAKVDEVEDTVEDNEAEDNMEEQKRELYCVLCSKKFKSDKQWKNHEQSKKHKEKVAELRGAFSEEDRESEATEEDGRTVDKETEVNGDHTGHISADEYANMSRNQFEGDGGTGEETEGGNTISSGEDYVDSNLASDDNEASILESMVSGLKSRKKTKNPTKKIQVDVSGDELDFMEYNDTKVSRRNRGGRRERDTRPEDAPETVKADIAESNGQAVKLDGEDDASHAGKSTSHPSPEPESKSKEDGTKEKSKKHTQQAINKNSSKKKETVSRSNVASRGRRQKAAAEGSEHLCEKCGQEFETRNKLHKHLGDTGHATLKSR